MSALGCPEAELTREKWHILLASTAWGRALSHSRPATGRPMGHLPELLRLTQLPEEPAAQLQNEAGEKLARTVFSELPCGEPEWTQLLLG